MIKKEVRARPGLWWWGGADSSSSSRVGVRRLCCLHADEDTLEVAGQQKQQADTHTHTAVCPMACAAPGAPPQQQVWCARLCPTCCHHCHHNSSLLLPLYPLPPSLNTHKRAHNTPKQDQDCPGGCFSPANAFDGDLAVLRIWDRVLSGEEVKRNMLRERPDSESGLVGLYIFDGEGVKTAQNGEPVAMDRSGECAPLGLDLPCRAVPFALTCHALPCRAVPFALRCVALRCFALRGWGMGWAGLTARLRLRLLPLGSGGHAQLADSVPACVGSIVTYQPCCGDPRVCVTSGRWDVVSS